MLRFSAGQRHVHAAHNGCVAGRRHLCHGLGAHVLHALRFGSGRVLPPRFKIRCNILCTHGAGHANLAFLALPAGGDVAVFASCFRFGDAFSQNYIGLAAQRENFYFGRPFGVLFSHYAASNLSLCSCLPRQEAERLAAFISLYTLYLVQKPRLSLCLISPHWLKIRWARHHGT